MKLYEVPRNSRVRLKSTEGGPPASIAPQVGEEYWFSRVDGMYSYCRRVSDDTVVHLPAWSEVEIV